MCAPMLSQFAAAVEYFPATGIRTNETVFRVFQRFTISCRIIAFALFFIFTLSLAKRLSANHILGLAFFFWLLQTDDLNRSACRPRGTRTSKRLHTNEELASCSKCCSKKGAGKNRGCNWRKTGSPTCLTWHPFACPARRSVVSCASQSPPCTRSQPSCGSLPSIRAVMLVSPCTLTPLPKKPPIGLNPFLKSNSPPGIEMVTS